MLAIERRGARDVSKRSHETTGQIFRYAIARGIATRNPAADFKPRDILAEASSENFARVDAKDLPTLLVKMESYDGDALTRFAMRLMAYTFVRTSELMVKAALPHLRRGSSIVNTGSETGLEGSKQLVDYSATKGAIHAFTKALAQMLVERGIRVNCVAPGPIWTPFNVADKDAEEVSSFGAKTPLNRPGQPEEVAPAFIFLVSEQCSSYVTGEILSVMGGTTTAA
ncbi:MAG TPA: SDR family oxidoreductase [Terracidiphilus sp.]